MSKDDPVKAQSTATQGVSKSTDSTGSGWGAAFLAANKKQQDEALKAAEDYIKTGGGRSYLILIEGVKHPRQLDHRFFKSDVP